MYAQYMTECCCTFLIRSSYPYCTALRVGAQIYPWSQCLQVTDAPSNFSTEAWPRIMFQCVWVEICIKKVFWFWQQVVANGTISPKWQCVPLLLIFDATRYLLPCRAVGEESFYPYHFAERDKIVDCLGSFTERS